MIVTIFTRHACSDQLISIFQLGFSRLHPLSNLVSTERLSTSCDAPHVPLRTKERSYETSCTDAHSARFPRHGM